MSRGKRQRRWAVRYRTNGHWITGACGSWQTGNTTSVMPRRRNHGAQALRRAEALGVGR